MNLITYIKQLFELTDSQPTTDHRALYDLEQVGQDVDGKNDQVSASPSPSGDRVS